MMGWSGVIAFVAFGRMDEVGEFSRIKWTIVIIGVAHWGRAGAGWRDAKILALFDGVGVVGLLVEHFIRSLAALWMVITSVFFCLMLGYGGGEVDALVISIMAIILIPKKSSSSIAGDEN